MGNVKEPRQAGSEQGNPGLFDNASPQARFHILVLRLLLLKPLLTILSARLSPEHFVRFFRLIVGMQERGTEALGSGDPQDRSRIVPQLRIDPLQGKRRSDKKRPILYFHAGAFAAGPMMGEMQFVRQLSAATNRPVLVHLYPLAPEARWRDGLSAVTEFLIQHRSGNLIDADIIGASAGGGLASAAVQAAAKTGIQLSGSMILICPWVDLSLSGDYSIAEKRDPFFSISLLRRLAANYAPESYQDRDSVSPLFGSFVHFPRTLVFHSGSDLLSVGSLEFVDRAIANGVDVTSEFGADIPHCYPVYQFLPEGRRALKRIVAFLRQKRTEQ